MPGCASPCESVRWGLPEDVVSTATASRDPRMRAGLGEQAGAPGPPRGADPHWQPAWDAAGTRPGTPGSYSMKDAVS